MEKIRYVKEPGFVYDLLYVFMLYYNRSESINRYINVEKRREDIVFYEEIVNQFPPFPEELAPFFYLKDNCGCVMTEFYFSRELKHFFNGHDVNFIYSKLSDVDMVRDFIIEFYLSTYIDVSNIKTLSTFTLHKALLKAELPDKIKQWVMAILANPTEYRNLLVKYMSSVEKVIVDYHKENYPKIIKLCDDFDLHEVDNILKITDNEPANENSEVLLSVCVLNRNAMLIDYTNNKINFIVGINGKECIEQVRAKRKPIDIPLFGKIMSDSSRIRILQMLTDKGEMTTGEIAKSLSTALPSSYYHLDMMLSSGMLCSRNVGRSVFYSIQHDYFENAADAVLKVIEK